VRKLIIIVAILLVVLALFVSAAKQSTTRPARTDDIEVNLINQEPDPAEPGRYVDVRFKFDNNGTGEAKNVIVELLPEYPFSLDPGIDSVKSVGTMQSRQRGDVGVIVKYRLRVDLNAVEGENELRLRYKIDNGGWIVPEEFFVDVQTQDAILSIESISIADNYLKPGSSSTVGITVSNKADSVLRDIEVKLGLGGLPFIPLGSSNEKSIYKIGAKKDYKFEFEILANPEAESGVYQVGLKISYSDELGKRYFKNTTIGLIIGTIPDLSVTLDDTDIYEKDNSGEIIVKVVNKGVTDVKFMNLKLMPGPDYKILSNDEIYLGNIDSDDFETADFDIFVDKTGRTQINLPVILEYKDANNNDFEDAIELKLNLYSGSEAKKFGFKEQNGFVGVLIVIIIVAAGLFYYRKYRKKKKKA